jgi:DNA invertase Pin-like site-specific DNA recombinase
MKIVAYIYSDPLLESPPDPNLWKLEVDRVYQDLGKRLSWQQLLADCQTQPPDCLLIRRLEELGDSIEEVSDRLDRIESLGIEVIATEQNYRSSQINNPNSREFKLNLSRTLQEIESNLRSRRIKQGHALNRVKALPPPGKAPYGYRRGKDRYIIDRSTAPVVKDFFDRFLLFGSLRGAVRFLEKRYGKKISVSTGRNWLSDPVYRGKLAYQNGEVVSDTHSSIISSEEAAQIDRLLRRNSRFPSRTASAPRSLAGLVVCQECQSTMTITRVTRKNKQQEYLYLRPINCTRSNKCKAIAYDKILNRAIEQICQDLPAAVAQLNLPNIDGIKDKFVREIENKKEILKQLPTLKEQGILDEETTSLRNYKLRIEIAELENKTVQLPPPNLIAIAKTVSISQFWLDLSEAERRFYFREFIEKIELIRDSNNEWNLKLVFIF